MIRLTDREERLVQTVRLLPSEEAEKILVWASALTELSQGKPVDWSDSWSDEDMRDATTASIRLFDQSHQDDE